MCHYIDSISHFELMSNRKHTFGNYLPQHMVSTNGNSANRVNRVNRAPKKKIKAAPKLYNPKFLPKPTLKLTDEIDELILQAMKDLGAINDESAVSESVLVCRIIYGGARFEFDRTDPGLQVYCQWFYRFNTVLYELKREKLVVPVFKDDACCTQLWYLL